MRFHKVFTRVVAKKGEKLAPGVLRLGGDTLPKKQPHADSDNLLQLRSHNINGFPVQRIVIGLIAPAGACIPVVVLVHDERSGAWFNTRSETDAVVRAGRLTFVDIPVAGDLQSPDHGGGAVEVRVLPQMPEDKEHAPPGSYTFAIAGDVSSPA